jgi:alkylation response protein AidB-like acyl-CoA dehydrogenase
VATVLPAGARDATAFILEKGTPGFILGRKECKMGIQASVTGELTFENARVPTESLLGRERPCACPGEVRET